MLTPAGGCEGHHGGGTPVSGYCQSRSPSSASRNHLRPNPFRDPASYRDGRCHPASRGARREWLERGLREYAGSLPRRPHGAVARLWRTAARSPEHRVRRLGFIAGESNPVRGPVRRATTSSFVFFTATCCARYLRRTRRRRCGCRSRARCRSLRDESRHAERAGGHRPSSAADRTCSGALCHGARVGAVTLSIRS